MSKTKITISDKKINMRNGAHAYNFIYDRFFMIVTGEYLRVLHSNGIRK